MLHILFSTIFVRTKVLTELHRSVRPIEKIERFKMTETVTRPNPVTYDNGVITTNTRHIPLPSTISPEAREYLISAYQPREFVELPAIEDKESWRAVLAGGDQYLAEFMKPRFAGNRADVQKTVRGGVTVYEGEPATDIKAGPGVVLHIHGGGMVQGGGPITHHWAALQATHCGRFVVAPDFRNPPDHPFPAALDDCFAVYLDLLETFKPSEIVIDGGSGGGNIALALIMHIHRGGYAMPAALTLQSPEADATEAGDSFQVLADVDALLRGGLKPQSRLYAGGRDLADLDISPLYSDFPKDFPPTWIQTGTRDLFLSNCVILHRALRRRNIEAELHVWEAMPHGGFNGTAPEDLEVALEFRHFVSKHLPAK